MMASSRATTINNVLYSGRQQKPSVFKDRLRQKFIISGGMKE